MAIYCPYIIINVSSTIIINLKIIRSILNSKNRLHHKPSPGLTSPGGGQAGGRSGGHCPHCAPPKKPGPAWEGLTPAPSPPARCQAGEGYLAAGPGDGGRDWGAPKGHLAAHIGVAWTRGKTRVARGSLWVKAEGPSPAASRPRPWVGGGLRGEGHLRRGRPLWRARRA